MKIAIYAIEIPSTVFIENLIKGLADKGHDMYIYGKYKKDPQYSQYPNIHVIKEPQTKIGMVLFACKNFFQTIIKNPKFAFKLLQISKDTEYIQWIYRFNLYSSITGIKPDIFHIQWANTIIYLDTFFSNHLAKTVVSFRGTHINVTPLYQEDCRNGYIKLFPLIDGFHGVSHRIIEEGKKYDSTIGNRSQVAYPAVTQATLDQFSVTAPNKTGQYQIISIGRHHWKKGYNYAFDAIKILKDRNFNIHYTIIAQGTLDEQLLHQIKELGIENNITIQGGLPHQEVLKTVKQADVFLLPSLEEGVANVALEAMAVGTPIVSTDCGGMLEVIENGVNGFIVKSAYAIELSNALEKVFHLNVFERERMILAAHETIKKNHRIDIQLLAIEKLYNQVLQS